MRSVLFQTACAFCAAFSFLAINTFESAPKGIETAQVLSCHKCRRPACSGCGGAVIACDCEDCRKKLQNVINEDVQQMIAGCRCGDGGIEMMACSKCGGKKKKKKAQPAMLALAEFSIAATTVSI